MKTSTYKNYENLPLYLNAETISTSPGIAISSAYELMQKKDFPTLKVGNHKLVKKEKVYKWVDENFGNDKRNIAAIWNGTHWRIISRAEWNICLRLSNGEIAVYAYLHCYKSQEIFQYHLSYKTIGNAVDMSKTPVDSLIEKQLIAADLIDVITQKGEKRNRKKNALKS